jgi:catalase
VETSSVADKPFPVSGLAQRNKFVITEDTDFEQPRAFWTKVLKEESKEYLVNAMTGNMKPCRVDIKERMIKLCSKIHPEFGQRLAKGLDLSADMAKL